MEDASPLLSYANGYQNHPGTELLAGKDKSPGPRSDIRKGFWYRHKIIASPMKPLFNPVAFSLPHIAGHLFLNTTKESV